MAKQKFSLTLAPTFKATVNIPVPGDKAAPVEFTFKGRTRDEFREFLETLKDAEDVEAIMSIASGWELPEPFDKANVTILVENYLGAAKAILDKYVTELTQARLGN